MTRAITHLIEYRPYRMRNECCALGLLALLPDGECRVHIASSLRKVRAMHPATDIGKLRDDLEQLASDLRRDPQLLDLYRTGGVGGLNLSAEPGYIDFANADEYERAVRWALGYMVEPTAPTAQRERAPVSRLFVEVKTYFANLGWLAGMGQGIRDHRIIQRYAISADEGIGVDFALLNTSMHYMQTVDLRTASNPTQKRHEAQSKWFALGMADALTPGNLSGNGVQRYAVIAGAETDEGKKAVKAAHRVANGGVFVHESANDMDELMAIYARAMQQDPLPASLPT